MSSSNPVVSFFASLASKLGSLFKKAPSLAVQVSSAVNYCVPFIETLDTLVTPELALVLNPILDKIKTGLGALSVTITQATTPAGVTNVNSILSSIQNNLGSLLNSAQVSNTTSVTQITAVVKLLTAEIAAIQSSVANSTPTKA